jgi:predicted permease
VSWREAWRLADVPFGEVAYQAIYAVRQGNLPPTATSSGYPDPHQLARKARSRVTQSKLMVSFVLALISLGVLVLLAPASEEILGSGLPHELYVGALLMGALVLELALLWWTSLQVLPTYLNAPVLPLLETLPIPGPTLDRMSMILFLRLVDTPVLTCLVLTPLAVGLGLGSVLAGLATIPGVFVVALVALRLSLSTSRFFIARVAGARGGGRTAVVRWAYLSLWTVPAFAMYAFVTFFFPFFRGLEQLVVVGADSVIYGITFIFPFPLALLPEVALASAQGETGGLLVVPGWVIAGCLLYIGIAVALLIGLRTAVRDLARSLPHASPSARPDDTRLRGGSRAAAVVRKDLRIASRTPGFAFLILLPILNAIALGAYTLVTNTSATDAYNVAVATVATEALLATFFGPAFFAIEVMGFSYSRTLPLPRRSLMGGKVALVAGLYLGASSIVLGLTLLTIFNPGAFFLFILAELPAVAAAALLEFGILYRVSDRKGLPITNLYAGAWWALIVAIPGVFVAGIPLVTFLSLRPTLGASALGVMAAVSLTLLAVFGTWAIFGRTGKRA